LTEDINCRSTCSLVHYSLFKIFYLPESCNEYDYAVPNELGKLLPEKFNSMKNELAVNGHTGTNRLIQLRLKDLKLPRIPKQHVRTLKKLGDGAFGTVRNNELYDK